MSVKVNNDSSDIVFILSPSPVYSQSIMDFFLVIYPLWCSYLFNMLEEIADYKRQSRQGIALKFLCLLSYSNCQLSDSNFRLLMPMEPCIFAPLFLHFLSTFPHSFSSLCHFLAGEDFRLFRLQFFIHFVSGENHVTPDLVIN